MNRLIRDTALRERMGQAALIRSRRYSREAVMPQIEAMYASAQAGGPRFERRLSRTADALDNASPRGLRHERDH